MDLVKTAVVQPLYAMLLMLSWLHMAYSLADQWAIMRLGVTSSLLINWPLAILTFSFQ